MDGHRLGTIASCRGSDYHLAPNSEYVLTRRKTRAAGGVPSSCLALAETGLPLCPCPSVPELLSVIDEAI